MSCETVTWRTVGPIGVRLREAIGLAIDAEHGRLFDRDGEAFAQPAEAALRR